MHKLAALLLPAVVAIMMTAGANAQTVTPEASPTASPTSQPLPKYTICHRTNSVTNPYVIITVRQVAVDGVAGNSGSHPDHFGEHKGPIFDPANPPPPPHNPPQWGDIIPPVPGFHDGLNWTAEGQTILENGCKFPPPTSPPPTSPPPTSPPPTSPPPTSPPPTSPPPTSPPPTSPPPLNPGTPTAICVGNVPYLAYDIKQSFPPGTTVDITFINPHGKDFTYANRPLTGQVLWPGASATPPLQWPGWTQLPDGTYIEKDNYGWTRPVVDVLFEVNPHVTVTVHYPPASAVCANPPSNPNPPSTPTAFTGADLKIPLGMMVGLSVLGIGSLLLRRKSREI